MHRNKQTYTTHAFGLATLLGVAIAAAGCDGEDTNNAIATATEGTTATETGAMDSLGDGSSGGFDCTSPPSHAAVIQPIWDAACVAGCHEPGGTWSSMDMTASVAYDFLVDFEGVQTQVLPGVNVVVAGDTDNSYLLTKLNGNQEVGTLMPQSADPLAAGDIALIEQWIACGAAQ